MDMKAVVTRALEIRKEAKRIIDAIENGIDNCVACFECNPKSRSIY